MSTHKQSQNRPTKVKYTRLTRQTKETKNYIYQVRTELTKAQTGKQTKAKCQVGNKATKTKLTNMLRGKDRKKRKTRYAKLNGSRLKRLTARGKEGNKGTEVEKI